MEFLKFLAFISLTLSLASCSSINDIKNNIVEIKTYTNSYGPPASHGSQVNYGPQEGLGSQDSEEDQYAQDSQGSQDSEEDQYAQDSQCSQDEESSYNQDSQGSQDSEEDQYAQDSQGSQDSEETPHYTEDSLENHSADTDNSYMPAHTSGPVTNYPPIYTPVYNTPEHTTLYTTPYTTTPRTTRYTTPYTTTPRTTRYTTTPRIPPTQSPVTTHRPIYTYPPVVPTHTTTPRPFIATHPTEPTRAPLYCYSCNANQAACSVPTLNLSRLNTEHYVPCNGQCIQYQNQWDGYTWYRGCSWEMDFGNGMARQPSVLEHKGNVFYFCDTNGCNIRDIQTNFVTKPTLPYDHTVATTQFHHITSTNPVQKPTGYYNKAMTLINDGAKKEEVASLYCFSCNENLAACSIPTLNMRTLLLNYLTPCHGQCIQYQNQFDNNKWYRGCSSSKDFGNGNGRQPPVLVHKETTYFFCETFGCNLNIGNFGSSQYYEG